MAEASDAVPSSEESSESYFITIMNEIFTSPLNLVLLGMCGVILYKIYRSSEFDRNRAKKVQTEDQLPKLAKQDINLEQLKLYDGKDPSQCICVAVNGKVFDVTRGKRHYGPGGSYCKFAGHDASRALATFNVDDVKDEYDDLSDLSSIQMDSVREWEMQFTEKYEYVGRLLKPGEQPGDYSEDDDNRDGSKNVNKEPKEKINETKPEEIHSAETVEDKSEEQKKSD